MKRFVLLLISLLLIISLVACSSPENTVTPSDSENTGTASSENLATEAGSLYSAPDDILVVYFSRTGHTRPLALYAAEYLNADIFSIEAEIPYTDEDIAYYTDCRADREQKDPDARPEISGRVEDMSKYGTVILAYPIWHGQAPRIISTFLESYDFSGKTIIPFCTSASSPIGNSDTDLHKLCDSSVIWKQGRRFPVDTTKEEIITFLNESGIDP